MSQLIEEYLRAKGVRYFRGHHDDEYFFVVDTTDAAGHHRLHVHLEGGQSGGVVVSITPGRYFPIGSRELLTDLACRWAARFIGARATVVQSSDPTLVGVVASSLDWPTDAQGLAEFVEGTVSSAIDLFGRMWQAAAPTPLRDAG